MSRRTLARAQLYMATRIFLFQTFAWMPTHTGIGGWFPPRVKEVHHTFEDGSTLVRFEPA